MQRARRVHAPTTPLGPFLTALPLRQNSSTHARELRAREPRFPAPPPSPSSPHTRGPTCRRTGRWRVCQRGPQCRRAPAWTGRGQHPAASRQWRGPPRGRGGRREHTRSTRASSGSGADGEWAAARANIWVGWRVACMGGAGGGLGCLAQSLGPTWAHSTAPPRCKSPRTQSGCTHPSGPPPSLPRPHTTQASRSARAGQRSARAADLLRESVELLGPVSERAHVHVRHRLAGRAADAEGVELRPAESGDVDVHVLPACAVARCARARHAQAGHRLKTNGADIVEGQEVAAGTGRRRVWVTAHWMEEARALASDHTQVWCRDGLAPNTICPGGWGGGGP